MKLKLNEQQLMRANRAYFNLGAAEVKVGDLKEEYLKTMNEIKAEVKADFNRFDPVTGETDIELPLESTAIEVVPPRRKRK
jgi:hypothetical protein